MGPPPLIHPCSIDQQHSHPPSPIPLRSMVVAAASARCCSVVTPILHHSRPAAASALRLPRRITRPPLSCSTSASPLVTVASMDAPPQGYRTNVGICLANPSLTKASSRPLKPDPSFSSARCPHPHIFSGSLVLTPCLRPPCLQIFLASRIDIPSAWQMPQVTWDICSTHSYNS